jgi:hypothetical protein
MSLLDETAPIKKDLSLKVIAKNLKESQQFFQSLK